MIFEFDGFGFKFGPFAAAETEAASGMTIGTLFSNMKDESKATLCLIYYFYGAARSYNMHKGIKQNITPDGIADLLEKIGFEKAMQVFTESLQMPKNSEAPKVETGQTQG